MTSFLHALTTRGLIVLALTAVATIAIVGFVTIRMDRSSDAAWQRWYTRIDSFPSTKALILFAMFNFLITGLVVAGNAIYFVVTSQQPSNVFVDILGTWLDKVLVLSGIATVQFGVKRATEKPGVTAPESSPSTSTREG